MHISEAVAGHARRKLSPPVASALLAQAAALDEGTFDGQDLDRVAAAMVSVAADGATVGQVIDLATTDWRDLLVAGGLAEGDWPQRLAERLTE